MAAIGVAAINYAASCSEPVTSGNLVAPPPDTDAAADAASDAFITSGNLVAPVVDAGPDATDASPSDTGTD